MQRQLAARACAAARCGPAPAPQALRQPPLLAAAAGLPGLPPPSPRPPAGQPRPASRGVCSLYEIPGKGAAEGAAPSTGSKSRAYELSEDRLHKFLKAEVSFYAAQEPNSISVKQILDAGSPEKAAVLTHKELPIRFSQRILQIETLGNWKENPELCEVYDLYTRTFHDLRLTELDLARLDSFTEVIQRLKGRMRTVIPHLATAMRRLQAEGRSEAMLGEWMDDFLLSRIGTEMLTSQYIACVEPKNGRRGIVDNRCDPAAICMQAARHAKKLCRKHFLLQHDVEIVVESSEPGASGRRIRFPYVPQYLFYIMVELLKNSARATVEVCGGNPQQIQERPIVITVSADPSEVAIRVQDVAGGIPFGVEDRVWSYMYSTASKNEAGTAFSQQGTPLAGYGVGLPLSRLYARYLGGSLHVHSLPGVGTCAYLYLKRLETEAREELPRDYSSGMSSLSSVADMSYGL